MSNNLLDSLIEQAKALTEQEQRLLVSHLTQTWRSDSEEKKKACELSADVKYRKREYQWMKEHGDEYAGQWVALEGDCLIARGSSARQVLAEADKVGAKLPFIARVESPDDLPFGGW